MSSSSDVVRHYDRVRGQRSGGLVTPNNLYARRKQARILLEEYGFDDIAGCIEWLDVDKWAKHRSWSLAYVLKKMPEFLVHHATGPDLIGMDTAGEACAHGEALGLPVG